jgi:hypothetical protein
MVHLVGDGAYYGIGAQVRQSQHQVAAANNPEHREAAEGIERSQPFSGSSFNPDLFRTDLFFTPGDSFFNN